MFDPFFAPLCETYRYRCIAHDRRGFGLSEWAGIDGAEGSVINYDVFANDFIQILERLHPRNGFVLIGASIGCSEIVHALSRSSYLRDNCKVSISSHGLSLSWTPSNTILRVRSY